jgi:hypothetical protein
LFNTVKKKIMTMMHIERPIRRVCKYSTSDILEGMYTLFGYKPVNVRHMSKQRYVVILPKQQLMQLFYWLSANKSEEYVVKEDIPVKKSSHAFLPPVVRSGVRIRN